jgi:autotransporter family porin
MRSNYLFLAIVFLVTVFFTILVPFDRDSLSAQAQQSQACSAISFPYTLSGSTNTERVANLNVAIDCANANSTADLIDLDGQSLTLTAPIANWGGETGLKAIQSGLTIRNGEIIRDPNADGFRILAIASLAEVYLENLTLRNGGHGNFESDGAAIHNGGTLTVHNSTVTGGKTYYGAAIYNLSSGSLYLNNSVITGNLAIERGGAIRNRGTIVITNSTIAGNYASLSGGGVSIAEGDVTINNSILSGNGSPTNPNVDGSYTGSFNLIDDDAQFINLVSASSAATNDGDYRLDEHSPAIDAGSNSFVPSGLSSDRDGNPRFFDDYGVTDTGAGSAPIVDIGAYERQAHSPYTTVDLSISKAANSSTIMEGNQLSYTITVENIGANPVVGAMIQDNFPSTLTGITWTASASGGAQLSASSGTGNINELVNLPVASSLTFSIQAQVASSGSGTITNTAQIIVPNGYYDVNPSNNTASASVNLLPAPTATPTNTPLPTNTPTPTNTPVPSNTATATAVPPTATPSNTATATATPSSTATPSNTATATAVPPTATPSSTATPSNTATATAVPPTATPSSTTTATAVPPTATSTPIVKPSASATTTPRSEYSVFLPVVKQAGHADLVAKIELVPNKTSFAAGEPVEVQVIISNQGTAAAQGFWVDLYINPSSPPSAVNQIWNERCGMTPCFGLAWQVEESLAPGQSMTLTSQKPLAGFAIWPGWFAAGTSDLYAYVDSFNPGNANGTVLESNEANNHAELRGLSVTGTNPELKVQLSTIPKR